MWFPEVEKAAVPMEEWRRLVEAYEVAVRASDADGEAADRLGYDDPAYEAAVRTMRRCGVCSRTVRTISSGSRRPTSTASPTS